ncbi:hypothetical protein ACVXHA_07350 [Escherichia coli]
MKEQEHLPMYYVIGMPVYPNAHINSGLMQLPTQHQAPIVGGAGGGIAGAAAGALVGAGLKGAVSQNCHHA